MSQQMTKVLHVAPGHIRVTRFEVVRDRVRRFADDLDQSLRSPLPSPVGVKQLTTARHKFGDLSSGFEYVRDSQIVGSTQIGTAS